MKKSFYRPLVAFALWVLSHACPVLAAEGQTLEVFSWWTSRGEAAALDALFQAYQQTNPDVEILNAAVAGGGGSAARPLLQTRLADGNPPDTWQVHPGYDLERYVEGGYGEPVTALYQAEGWDKVVPKGLLDRLRKGGEFYAVLGRGAPRQRPLVQQKGVGQTGDPVGGSTHL